MTWIKDCENDFGFAKMMVIQSVWRNIKVFESEYLIANVFWRRAHVDNLKGQSIWTRRENLESGSARSKVQYQHFERIGGPVREIALRLERLCCKAYGIANPERGGLKASKMLEEEVENCEQCWLHSIANWFPAPSSSKFKRIFQKISPSNRDYISLRSSRERKDPFLTIFLISLSKLSKHNPSSKSWRWQDT